MPVEIKISISQNIWEIYKKRLLLIVLVYYYLTPSTVNGNEQMYGRTL